MIAFMKMMRDDSGASAAEYALILAIVGTGLAVGALYLGGTIGNAVNSAGNCINNPSSVRVRKGMGAVPWEWSPLSC